MQYKGSRKTVPEIARELDVDAVIEGTVLRSGDHLRITLNLIRARPEMHLWAEVYETEAEDFFKTQGEVAHSVTRVLRLKVTSPEQVRQQALCQPASPGSLFPWTPCHELGYRTSGSECH
jgi:hypothetical protein